MINRERLGLEFPIIQQEGFLQEKQAPADDDQDTETATDAVDISDVEEEEEPCCDNLVSNTVEIVPDSSSSTSDNTVPISSETETIKGNKKYATFEYHSISSSFIF